ncbi:MAG: hypothetical protein ACREIA_17895, partial [Opitutaceae bacterium]
MLALLSLLSNARKQESVFRGWLSVTFVAAGVALFAAGFSLRIGAILFGSLPEYRAEASLWEKNVSNYLQTHDPSALRPAHIPYPSAESLRARLDAPAIRAALPPGVSPQAGARAWLSRGVELLMDFGAAWL